MELINIIYRNKKLEKICTNLKEAKKQIGDKTARNLIRRIVQLKAFDNLQAVPSNLPWRREKLEGYNNRWSVRIDSNYRLEFIASDDNILKLNNIKNIEIVEVSKHYE